jgi:hypothetical protein
MEWVIAGIVILAAVGVIAVVGQSRRRRREVDDDGVIPVTGPATGRPARDEGDGDGDGGD